MEHTTLFFKQGSSDKTYAASIQPKDGGYVVLFQYGRRGSALQSGQKNPVPVPYDQAKKIYDQLLAGKIAKGYSPGADGTPYQQTSEAHRATGIHCQLLNPADEDQVERLIADPAWWLQEKHDGRRLLLRKQGNTITGINRLGLAVALPQTLIDDAAQCPIDCLLDGEAIGDTLHAFDALLISDDEIGGLRYGERYLRLMNLLASFQHRCIRLVETAFLPAHKAERLVQLRRRHAEGVVFRHTNAPYIAGRPDSGGQNLKYKFCETASFIVGKVNAKRSVSLLIFDGDRIKAAGNVTIPPNHDIPVTGQIVECRYLLPRGQLRFYRRDGAQLQFTGENVIDHTAKGETVRVNTGNAFDLIGERKRTNFKVDSSSKWVDETFEIKVRNRKAEPVEIRVVEHLYRGANWEIRQNSNTFLKTDAQTIEFRIPLPPDAEQVVTYTAHYTW